jgi:hypothetical protein
MNNPTDRIFIKKFTKIFRQEVIKPSVQLHERLTSHETAESYNKIYQRDNSIETVKGRKKKDRLVLKVRITQEYRKFFYFVSDKNNETEFLNNERWSGQFNDVRNIHVFEINKHDYKNI